MLILIEDILSLLANASPLMNHVIRGTGNPDALQENYAFALLAIVMFMGGVSITGETIGLNFTFLITCIRYINELTINGNNNTF